MINGSGGHFISPLPCTRPSSAFRLRLPRLLFLLQSILIHPSAHSLQPLAALCACSCTCTTHALTTYFPHTPTPFALRLIHQMMITTRMETSLDSVSGTLDSNSLGELFLTGLAYVSAVHRSLLWFYPVSWLVIRSDRDPTDRIPVNV